MEKSSNLHRTALYSEHLKLGARMIDFSGWELPVQFTSIIQEHLWTRENASIFDVSHMGQIFVKGDRAGEFLDWMLTNSISSLETGQCRYTLMLNEEAGIIDDLIAYRIGGEEFMLVVNAGRREKDFSWLLSHRWDGIELEDRTFQITKIDLQGPRSLEVLNELMGRDFSFLGYFRFVEARMQDDDVLVSRTGYTGELGYEIYIAWDQGPFLWNRLLEFDLVRPAGLGARDTLRLEVGYPLYGQDIDETTTPIEANLERFVFWDKEFVGKEALKKRRSEGASHRLVGLKGDGKRPFRKGDKVFSLDGEEVGWITSGSYSPSLEKAIGLAYIKDGFEVGDRVRVEGQRAGADAEIFSYPFYKQGTVRMKLDEVKENR